MVMAAAMATRQQSTKSILGWVAGSLDGLLEGFDLNGALTMQWEGVCSWNGMTNVRIRYENGMSRYRVCNDDNTQLLRCSNINTNDYVE